MLFIFLFEKCLDRNHGCSSSSDLTWIRKLVQLRSFGFGSLTSLLKYWLWQILWVLFFNIFHFGRWWLGCFLLLFSPTYYCNFISCFVSCTRLMSNVNYTINFSGISLLYNIFLLDSVFFCWFILLSWNKKLKGSNANVDIGDILGECFFFFFFSI